MLIICQDVKIWVEYCPSRVLTSCTVFAAVLTVFITRIFREYWCSWLSVCKKSRFSTESLAPVTQDYLVDQVSVLSSTMETVLFLFFVSFRLILLLKWELWMILFSAEAILASSTSKFDIEIPRVDDEDLKSSTESTNSTSLIHCIASVGNCEQVHTLVLNLIFQLS